MVAAEGDGYQDLPMTRIGDTKGVSADIEIL
jgi:hypothetical protein